MTWAIQASHLHKRFGAVHAVQDVTLQVKEGEIYGLIGANGAGKTTTIRLLLGLLKPDEGRVELLGRSMPNVDVLGQVGYMPQDLALYPDLSVLDHLLLFADIFGLSGAERRQAVAQVLHLVELEGKERAVVAHLSGGMKRRLSLACSLLHRPKVLFLDEPTVGVDVELRAAFWAYFQKLRDEGRTILITTHSMEEAARCDRIGFMHRGRLVVEDTPRNILRQTKVASLEEAFLNLLRQKEPVA